MTRIRRGWPAGALLALLLAGAVPAKLLLPPNSPTDEAMRLAWSHLEAGREKEARQLLLRVIELKPDAAPAYVLLGRTYLAEAPLEARKAAIAALRRNLGSQDALDLLTASFARIRARVLPAEQELRLGALEIDDYGQVLERHPDWPQALFRRASQGLALERLLPRGDTTGRAAALGGAVADLQRTLELIPDTAPPRVRSSAHYQLGRAFNRKAALAPDGLKGAAKLRDDAAVQFMEAARIDPERADAIAELVQVRLAQGRTRDAMEQVRGAIARSETPAAGARLNAMLGNLYVESGRAKQALEPLERAVKLDPTTAHAWLGLLKAHRSLDDEDDAYAAMEQAVTAIPRFVTAHLELGTMDVARGDHDSAIARFTTLLKVPPGEAVVIGTRPSRSAFRNERYHAAAAWLAWLYLEKRNQPETALKAVALAQRYGPLDASLADTRGWALFRLGRVAEARQVLEDVARESGDFPAVHFHLASALHALGEREAALESVERALSFKKDFSERADARKLKQELSRR